MTTWDEACKAYDDMLDEVYGPVSWLFYAAHALKQIDPLLYRINLLKWLAAEGIDIDKLEGVAP